MCRRCGQQPGRRRLLPESTPPGLKPQHIEELREGAPVMVAGQLTERWTLQDGRASRRGAIVANLIHPGQAEIGGGER